MGLSSLGDFLEKNAAKEEQINWEEVRQSWIAEVNEFYGRVQEWLKEYEEKGLIKYELSEATMEEEYLGLYQIRKMFILISGQKVEIDPVGRIIIGARGRIDMIGRYGKVKFLLVDENAKGPNIKITYGEEQAVNQEVGKIVSLDWKIATPPPNIQFLTLNADSFSDALLEVING